MATSEEIRRFMEKKPHDCNLCPIKEDCNGGEYIDFGCDDLLAFKAAQA